jgi:hypothetical protein
MRVTRILDLMVLLLLATVLLMPRPDATVKPALALDPELRDRVAELQSMLVGQPDSIDAAIELANIYLDGHRPDWALATLTGVTRAHPEDYRLYHLRAIAYADRFEGQPAFEAASKAMELCERVPPPAGTPICGEDARARLALLKSSAQAVAGVDMKNQPYLAKERIFQQLHPVFLPRPKSKGAAPSTKPSTPSANPPQIPTQKP